MKLLALFSLFVVVASNVIPFDPELDVHWINFKERFQKSYSMQEEVARRLIWEMNVADIVEHNLQADLGLVSFRIGLNEYSDLKHEEFRKSFNGYKGIKNSEVIGTTWMAPSNVILPAKVDWREKGYVTPIKDQKKCGSCYAFSATGALEGQHMRKTGSLVSLSEQNIIDCSARQGNEGCNGGLMDNAFSYIKSNHGIDTEESYPYIAKVDGCHFQKKSIGATCSGFVDIKKADEEALKAAIATVGPISVAIDASHKSFQSYKSGIYEERKCNDTELDHGVLAVGYGTDDGVDYWLVKNSWGTSWGMNGYIKMIRNKKNHCGIATIASYPLV